jgi:hypothetical protein
MTQRTKADVKASSKAPYTQISFIPDYEKFGMKNMTDDIYRLFNRRVIDACATTPNDVSVFFNGEKLMIKDFEKYCELFLDKKEQPFVYESSGERWEVVASISGAGVGRGLVLLLTPPLIPVDIRGGGFLLWLLVFIVEFLKKYYSFCSILVKFFFYLKYI